MSQKPSVCRVVHYFLPREHFRNVETSSEVPVPIVASVTKVRENGNVNLSLLQDGEDGPLPTTTPTDVTEGKTWGEPGTWSWPPRV